MRGLIDKIIFGLCVLMIFPACKGRDIDSEQNGQTKNIQKSSVEDESDSVNWSSVTPEILWQHADELYQTEGPKMALSFIQRGMSHGVVSDDDADQVRAVFLYELGRFDEAFMALARYIITVNRPDLLELRAKILGKMGRYEDARRDFETLIDPQSTTVTPEILYSAALLYDDIGDWDKNRETVRRLDNEFPDSPLPIRYKLRDALASDDYRRIASAKEDYDNQASEGEPDPVSVFAYAYNQALQGNFSSAIDSTRKAIIDNGCQPDLITLLVKLDIESADYKSFEKDLRSCFEDLDSIAWLDSKPENWPPPTDHPVEVARLLDLAGAFYLGNGDRVKARALAERALSLDPYNFNAKQQLALVSMNENDFSGAFLALNEAVKIAPPTDARVRIRILQLTSLAPAGTDIPWDIGAIASELEKICDHREKQFPSNAFFKSARAEVYAARGDFKNALVTIEKACALPGATRDFRLREIYFLIKLGRIEDARGIAEKYVPSGSPYLLWVFSMMLESLSKNDEALGRFALEMKDRIDPKGEHDDFFVAPSPDPEEE
ncbi:MAG: tetratricopeptide repeat protein [bacterium]